MHGLTLGTHESKEDVEHRGLCGRKLHVDKHGDGDDYGDAYDSSGR